VTLLVTDPLSNTSAMQYDGNGNTTFVTRTDVCTITTPTVANEVFISFMRYDSLSRLVVSGMQGADGDFAGDLTTCCTWPVLTSTLYSQFGYDSRGNRVTMTDAKLNTTLYIFDGASRQIETQQQMRQLGDGTNPPAVNQTFLTAGGGHHPHGNDLRRQRPPGRTDGRSGRLDDLYV
jgi:YD repeat-containing protein